LGKGLRICGVNERISLLFHSLQYVF
jgi:hypothetical protein